MFERWNSQSLLHKRVITQAPFPCVSASFLCSGPHLPTAQVSKGSIQQVPQRHIEESQVFSLTSINNMECFYADFRPSFLSKIFFINFIPNLHVNNIILCIQLPTLTKVSFLVMSYTNITPCVPL